MLDKNNVKKIMTFKSGQFALSRNFGNDNISKAHVEANVLNQAIMLPILPRLAAYLDEELIVRSIFGTAAIEGNPLREEEVAQLLSGTKSPRTTKRVEKEILNLKQAYDFADKVSASASLFELTEEIIKESHSIITDGLDYKNNIPGHYRNEVVHVGNVEHGGIYTPPKVFEDIRRLMAEFIAWINSEEVVTCPYAPFARAGLAHYHLGLIHPFSDGNGRTARLIEGMLLKAARIKYLPRMLSNYYYRHVDDYYWAFSNSIKSKSDDITPFMEFFFRGVVDSLRQIRDNIEFFIRKSSLRDYFSYLRNDRSLSERQHNLLEILLDQTDSTFIISDLFARPVFKPLYRRIRSARTPMRDLKKLVDMKILLKEGSTYKLNYKVLE